MRGSNREIDESEAEEEVHQQDRMEKLVKSMSKQSRRSHRLRRESNAAGPATAPQGLDTEVTEESEKKEVV